LIARLAARSSGRISLSSTSTPGPAHRVLHIIGGSLFGGATKMVIATCKDLAAQGYEVQVLASDPATVSSFAAAGIYVHRRPRIRTTIAPLVDPVVGYELSRLLRREQFTVVHTHTSKAGFIGRFAARLAGVPHILHTVHGFAFHEFSRRSTVQFYAKLEKQAARWCDCLIFVNEFHRRWALELEIAPYEKTVVIPNGLPSVPPGGRTSRDELRNELGLPNDGMVIGAIGRLAPDKRLEDLIEVMPTIVAEFPSAFLLLVGDGPSKEAVLGAAHRLGLDDHLVVVGFVSDVERYYEVSDVVVLPTIREGLSISLLEAMRAGKAIVTTAIGSNKTVVEADRSAVLVPPASPEALHSGILKLLRNPEHARSLGEQARVTFASEFTEDVMLERIRKLYATLPNGRPAASAASAQASPPR
jgi:glycosyltransferase involved in cell wall biosynthesis